MEKELWALGLLALGALLGYAARVHQEAVAHRGQWGIIRAILRFWRNAADPYLNAERRVLAPLVRLPLDAYEKAIGELVKSAAITDNEIVTLYYVLDMATQFNLSLDLLQDIRGGAVDWADLERLGRIDRFLDEAGRAGLKARRLVPGPAGSPSRYDEAMGLVMARLQTPYWKRVFAIHRGAPLAD